MKVAYYNSAPPAPVSGQKADLQVDATGALRVNVVAGGSSGGGTNSPFSTTFPTSGTAVGASDGTNMQPLLVDGAGSLKVTVVSGAPAGGTSSNFASAFPAAGTAMGASNGTTMAPLVVSALGNLKIDLAEGGVPAIVDNTGFTPGTTSGINLMGLFNDGLSGVTTTNAAALRMTAARQLLVVPQAAVGGGCTGVSAISAATTNATSLKSSPGTLYSLSCGNVGAGVAFLKLYDKASAPTVGTDTPIRTIPIPAGSAGAGVIENLGPNGLSFSTGIAYAITGVMTKADTTAVALAQVCANFGYV